jgi:hypothetical protein
MKHVILFIYFIAVSVVVGAVKVLASPEEIVRIKALIEKVEMHARSIGAQDADGVIEICSLLSQKEEFVALQKEMAESWPYILNHLSDVAPTDIGKASVLISVDAMSESSFIDYLNVSADLVEKGSLDRKYLMWAQFPQESRLSNTLIRRYDDSRVRAIILRSKAIFKDIPGQSASYDEMLNGESLKKLDRYQAGLKSVAERKLSETNSGVELVSSGENASKLDDPILQPARPNDGGIISNSQAVVAPIKPIQETKATRGFLLPVLAVFLAAFAGVAVWFFRKQ